MTTPTATPTPDLRACGQERAVRLRLSRAKGFDLQAHSLAVNGLPAVVVARPTKWGNPYLLDDPNKWWSRHPFGSRERAQGCVEHYERAIAEGFVLVPYTWLTPEERGDDYHSSGAHYVREVAPKYLGGRNLACWCALDAPCHADVLLRLANPVCDALPTASTEALPGSTEDARHG